MYYSGAYAPFGEAYSETGTSDRSFTGQNQDTASGSTTGLYDFFYREYAQYGRWISPDPSGRSAVNISNPQSWNRYAYVLNDPMNAIDPLGLDDCVMCLPELEDETGGGGGGGWWYVSSFWGAFDASVSSAQANQIFANWQETDAKRLLGNGGNYDEAAYANQVTPAIQFTGFLYGKPYEETFNSWNEYASWAQGIAALPASQCYQSAMVVAQNQGVTSVTGTCTAGTAGLTYKFQLDSTGTNVNQAAVEAAGGWPDPITWFHGGAPSWFLDGFSGGFFGTAHLVDLWNGTPVNAHIDPFGPLNPLHYIIQIPLGIFNGPSWSGTCSAIGGCSF